MVESGFDAVSVTDCAVLYSPPGGELDTVGACELLSYNSVTTVPTLPAVSLAKNFSVVSDEIPMGPEYVMLDVVGVLPSVV